MRQEPLELDVEGELRLKSRGGETEAVAPAPSASKLEQIHEESEKQSLPEQENCIHCRQASPYSAGETLFNETADEPTTAKRRIRQV
jgi:hypothetical protein